MMYVTITKGRGPEECEIAVKAVFQILQQEAIMQKIAVEVLEIQETKNGWNSVFFSIEGDDEEDFSKKWMGSIKWICQSPIRKNYPRKNWFVGIDMFPVPKNNSFNMNDLTITTMRSSGPGGQHINKTESAVRIKHNPTGLVVNAREERSQHRNKELALAKLSYLMKQSQEKDKANLSTEIWNNHNSLERGNAIQVYQGEGFKKMKI